MEEEEQKIIGHKEKEVQEVDIEEGEVMVEVKTIEETMRRSNVTTTTIQVTK